MASQRLGERHAGRHAEIGILKRFKERARALRSDICTLYLAAQHPKTPWHAKLFMAAIVAYAFSPIDLVPDFVPILGYLDELILLPIGISIALKMIPPDIVMDCRARADQSSPDVQRAGRIAAVVIVTFWIALAVLGGVWFYGAGQR
jgi:uncharacterized membrane protein YkvA (DUF1232 family)